MSRHVNSRATTIAALVVTIGLIVVFVGIRLPYLHSTLSGQIREFVLFPLFFCGLSTFVFIYKGRRAATRFQARMRSLPTTGARINSTILSVLGLLLIPGTGAWLSICIPAVLTQMFAATPIFERYEVTRVTDRGGPVIHSNVDLTIVSTTGEFVLPVLGRTYAAHEVHTGDHICAQGRTWMLGTVIDTFISSPGPCVSTRRNENT